MGLACSLLILLYVLGEVGYDTDIKNSDRIYRINSDKRYAQITEPTTPFPLAATMTAELAGIESVARAQWMSNAFVKLGEEYVHEYYFVSADREIFDLFSLEVVEGDPDRLLANPSSIVISMYIAAKYFPDESPLGKVLSVVVGDQPYELEVTGVFKDFPRKSTFRAQLFTSIEVGKGYIQNLYQGLEIDLNTEWYSGDSWYTYLLLSENADPARLRENLEGLSERHYTPDAVTHFVLQPIEGMYFHSLHLVNNYYFRKGNLTAIYILILIAVSILALACINYVILTSAQTMTRLREIGVRKVVGATRGELVVQILGESVLLAVLALPLAIGLMELALPRINELFRMRLQIQLIDDWPFTVGAVLVTVVAGLFSGAYVAFYQSAVQPVDVLRRRSLIRAGKFSLRRCLVVLQLTIFVALVSCAGIVYLQVDYAMNRAPGFDKDDLLLASPGDPEFAHKYQAFKNDALAIADIVSVTSASFFPPNDTRSLSQVPSAADPSVNVLIEGLIVDYDFVKTMGLTIVDGRDFSMDDDQPDSRIVILNETAVKVLGYESPVGSIYDNWGRVVGIVEDFSIHSVRGRVAPLEIRLNTNYVNEAAVRVKPGRKETVREQLNQLWAKHFPDDPEGFFSYDERLPYLYMDEKRVGEIVGYVALLAVLICCMGLFGLSLFVSRGRTKEIGVRKVFGASTSSVVSILVREYVWLVVIATVLSIPVTYYFMNRWLENFVYRMSIGWYVFAAAGFVALVVALATVSIQAFRAARANPTDSLRYE